MPNIVYKSTKMVDRVGTKQDNNDSEGVATTNANNKENKNNNDQDIVPRRVDVGTEKRANSSSSSIRGYNNNNGGGGCDRDRDCHGGPPFCCGGGDGRNRYNRRGDGNRINNNNNSNYYNNDRGGGRGRYNNNNNNGGGGRDCHKGQQVGGGQYNYWREVGVGGNGNKMTNSGSAGSASGASGGGGVVRGVGNNQDIVPQPSNALFEENKDESGITKQQQQELELPIERNTTSTRHNTTEYGSYSNRNTNGTRHNNYYRYHLIDGKIDNIFVYGDNVYGDDKVPAPAPTAPPAPASTAVPAPATTGNENLDVGDNNDDNSLDDLTGGGFGDDINNNNDNDNSDNSVGNELSAAKDTVSSSDLGSFFSFSDSDLATGTNKSNNDNDGDVGYNSSQLVSKSSSKEEECSKLSEETLTGATASTSTSTSVAVAVAVASSTLNSSIPTERNADLLVEGNEIVDVGNNNDHNSLGDFTGGGLGSEQISNDGSLAKQQATKSRPVFAMVTQKHMATIVDPSVLAWLAIDGNQLSWLPQGTNIELKWQSNGTKVFVVVSSVELIGLFKEGRRSTHSRAGTLSSLKSSPLPSPSPSSSKKETNKKRRRDIKENVLLEQFDLEINFGSWTKPWRNGHATEWYFRYRNEFPDVDFSDLYYWIFCNQFNGVEPQLIQGKKREINKTRPKLMKMSKTRFIDETKSKTHGATIVSTASSEESTDCMADSLSEIFKNIAKNAGTGPYLNIEGSDLAKLLDNNMIHVEETLPDYLRTELGKVSDEDCWVSIG
ncbi:hypothetical protein FRACYDRAFT_241275 [Fragilariopsis cylindrus CCMP1102]|uniref:Uncharacterized protein n=1 Tax=Fragilariopsis cylindrus CCMP1102 TaxID=635003 RepID=A0A1E7F963_9STRA|nr:hypothetical protein FRACYDRAFT_241275 [Fragilariopsis cylindrus CCMP1102]|eukprot:OEU14718.1 hypothetical protein FRACYDRAFT_241275 [Fragilariopsis cylindrus CCMP1102]